MSVECPEYHICRVCGDRASGFHYGVFCCEGCKGFFFRTVRANKRYNVCNKPDRCLVLKSSRNCCRFCRMQRCLEMGMSYEAVKMGRYKKSDMCTRKLMLTRVNSPDDLTISIYKGYMKANQRCKVNGERTEKEYLNMEATSTENNLYSLFVIDIVRFTTTFAKDIDVFQKLAQPTQRILIKSAIVELALLKDALNMDITENLIINHRLCYILNRSRCEEFGTLGVLLLQSNLVVRKLAMLNLTPVELSLLMALSLFSSDREGVEASADLQRIEETLLTTLQCQVLMNHKRHIEILAKIIEVMCVLRGLTTIYLDDLLNSDFEG